MKDSQNIYTWFIKRIGNSIQDEKIKKSLVRLRGQKTLELLHTSPVISI